MYYYRKKTNPVKWIIIIIVVIALVFFSYWFYQNYFSKIDFSRSDNDDSNLENNTEELSKILLSSLSFVQGDVQVSINGQDYQTVEKNTVLHEGDRIKTGSDSLVVLNLENQSIIRVGQNTEIILTNLLSEHLVITQNYGRTYYNLTNIKSFELISLDSRVQSHGSQFELITNNENKYIAVLSFDTDLFVELYDSKGLLMSRRIGEEQKALLDFNKIEIENKLKIDSFVKDSLASEDWYKWNFDLDAKIGQPIENEEIAQEDKELDNEPDFMTTDESLELAAEIKDSGIFLSWSVYNQDNFTAYKIVKSETNQDLQHPGNTVIKSSTVKGLNLFIDSNTSFDKKYYYRVCVLKDNDKVVCGNVVSVKTEPEEEEEEEVVVEDTTPPAGPGLSASVSVSGVSLGWSKNNEEDFKHYVVLKSMSNTNPNYPDYKLTMTKRYHYP